MELNPSTVSTVFSWAIWGSLAGGAGTWAAGWLARRTKIAEFRQAWIIELRKDISDYMGAAERYFRVWQDIKIAGSQEMADNLERDKAFPALNEAKIILYRIQLRINPRKNAYQDQDATFLETLQKFVDPIQLEVVHQHSSWHVLADTCVRESRQLLKREWEVTKGKANTAEGETRIWRTIPNFISLASFIALGLLAYFGVVKPAAERNEKKQIEASMCKQAFLSRVTLPDTLIFAVWDSGSVGKTTYCQGSAFIKGTKDEYTRYSYGISLEGKAMLHVDSNFQQTQ